MLKTLKNAFTSGGVVHYYSLWIPMHILNWLDTLGSGYEARYNLPTGLSNAVEAWYITYYDDYE